MQPEDGTDNSSFVVVERRSAPDVCPDCVDEHTPLRPLQSAGGRDELVMHVVWDPKCQSSVFTEFFARPETSRSATESIPRVSRSCHRRKCNRVSVCMTVK
jgi:hypothetical protein